MPLFAPSVESMMAPATIAAPAAPMVTCAASDATRLEAPIRRGVRTYEKATLTDT